MTPLEMLSSVVRPASDITPAKVQNDSGNAESALPPSTRVSISASGQTLSTLSDTTSRYKDIEDSDLPNEVKHLLRAIRDLRQMLAKLAKELQQVQADQSISKEEKRFRLLRIQGQMSSVNAALMQTTQALSSLMRDTKLDSSQQMTAAYLALK